MRIKEIFSNFKIRAKLMALSLITFFFLAIFAGISLFNNVAENQHTIQLVETNTRNSYDMQIKNQVQNAVTLLNGIYQKYLSGEITLEQAKKLGADLVRNLRYGNGGYFWVDTTEGVNVVLLGSDTEGTNRYQYQDTKGTLIVQEFIQNALEGKNACIDYWFPREGQTQAVRKRGFTELFQPFGWVIGTGNYIDDIDQQIAQTRQEQEDTLRRTVLLYALLFFSFGGLTLAAIFLISKNISDPLQQSVNLAVQISSGAMGVEIQEDIKKRKDEIGELSVSLEKMRNSIATLVESLREKADALSREKELLRTTLVSVGDGVISTSESGSVVLINYIAEQLTGWTQEEAFGRPLEEIFHIAVERKRGTTAKPVHKIFQDGRIVIPGNSTVLISKTGNRILIESSEAAIFGQNGSATGAVLVFRDVTEKKRKMEQIRYLGYHDQLTGLYNRTYFERQMAQIDLPENRPVSLIMADVNGLKLTNDAYGHLAGDKLIRKTAEVLKGGCRAEDSIFRIGGDEFVILLERTSLEEAQALVQRIQSAVNSQKDELIHLSVSLGCAEKTPLVHSMEDVLRQAEDNMYREKLLESKASKVQIIDNIKNQLFRTMQEDNENYPAISKACGELGKLMQLDARDIQDLSTAGLLHDIGKVTVNREILCKPGPLTEEEWIEVKHHSEAGYHILKSLSEMSQVSEYVLAHHERWDGAGYPKGLTHEEIPLPARIITVIDAYYAMTSDRPFRKAFTEEEALAEIQSHAGAQFDPAVTDVFVNRLARKRLTRADEIT